MSAAVAVDDAALPIPEVARRLAAMGVRWDERTIRRHLGPVSEWRGLTSGDVPSIRLGARDQVPAWWLREIADALRILRGESDNSDK